MKLIETLRNDLRTYEGDCFAQGVWVAVVQRFGEWRYGIRLSPVRKGLSFLYKVVYKLTQILTGVEYPCEAKMGAGTRIDHFGGIIVSGYASIGDYCVIRQGVTIGLKNETEPVAPKIGDHVSIGAGAKLLGDITIGSHVEIGANAVVLQDVPSHAIAVGIPARIIERKREQKEEPRHHSPSGVQ